MFDDLGIVYLIENAQQFWTGAFLGARAACFTALAAPLIAKDRLTNLFLCVEIEDILHILPDSTLSVLDATLKRFISFCSGHHGAFHALDPWPPE